MSEVYVVYKGIACRRLIAQVTAAEVKVPIFHCQAVREIYLLPFASFLLSNRSSGTCVPCSQLRYAQEQKMPRSASVTGIKHFCLVV